MRPLEWETAAQRQLYLEAKLKGNLCFKLEEFGGLQPPASSLRTGATQRALAPGGDGGGDDGDDGGDDDGDGDGVEDNDDCNDNDDGRKER